jgi:23S rRNA pseudouridine1911/1915/1917 synthase
MKEIFRFQVTEADNKKRFDEFLYERIGAVSRMHLRNLLLDERGRVNGNPEKPGYKLKKDDAVEIEIDLSAETSMKPEAIPLEILFEDEAIIVVNKPAEMLVHPTRNVKSGTLLNALSYHLNHELSGEQLRESSEQPNVLNPKSKFIRPGLVHRLDKKTSGLMIIAKTSDAHRTLADHFNRKLVEKKYLALVEGTLAENSGVINAPIGYDENLKQWRVLDEGKTAETRFRLLESRDDTTLLELEPVTGRTNQLRIHCTYIGHPIVGDVERGGREFPRLCLHAWKIGFWHPRGDGWIEFETGFEGF